VVRRGDGRPDVDLADDKSGFGELTEAFGEHRFGDACDGAGQLAITGRAVEQGHQQLGRPAFSEQFELTGDRRP
jgi:hypothetical protein